MVNTDNPSPAATLKDLQEFTNLIMTAMLDLETRISGKIDTKIKESEGRMLLAIENLHHDMVETHKDKITQHEDRIVRIEKHLQLAA